MCTTWSGEKRRNKRTEKAVDVKCHWPLVLVPHSLVICDCWYNWSRKNSLSLLHVFLSLFTPLFPFVTYSCIDGYTHINCRPNLSSLTVPPYFLYLSCAPLVSCYSAQLKVEWYGERAEATHARKNEEKKENRFFEIQIPIYILRWGSFELTSSYPRPAFIPFSISFFIIFIFRPDSANDTPVRSGKKKPKKTALIYYFMLRMK